MSELSHTTELIRQQMSDGLHIGAQMYVSIDGRAVADVALGESRPGVSMTSDSIMLWMSSTKPIGAVAIAQLWEKGLLNLDDPVARHIPEFAQNGKDRITIRHILTHTAGIRWIETGWPEATWAQIMGRINSASIERDWIPGRKAGYSPYASWFILAEIVQRLDGRPYADYVRAEIFQPIGMDDSWLAMSQEKYQSYSDRLGIMQNTQHQPPRDARMDSEAACTHVRPSGSGRGPIRELGRFYEMLLAGGTINGRQILRPQTVEALVAHHRVGMFDQTFKHVIDWGLGFVLDSKQYGPDTVPYGYGPFASPRTFGHSGMQSSCAFADPENHLVVAIVFNGMPGEAAHDKRVRAVLARLYEELGFNN